MILNKIYLKILLMIKMNHLNNMFIKMVLKMVMDEMLDIPIQRRLGTIWVGDKFMKLRIGL